MTTLHSLSLRGKIFHQPLPPSPVTRSPTHSSIQPCSSSRPFSRAAASKASTGHAPSVAPLRSTTLSAAKRPQYLRNRDDYMIRVSIRYYDGCLAVDEIIDLNA